MLIHSRLRTLTFTLGLLLLGCAQRGADPPQKLIASKSAALGYQPVTSATLLVEELPAGVEVKQSGALLMAQPPGWIRILADSTRNDSILVIALHGYASRGYEWVTSVTGLAERYGWCYFYRYNWKLCPDQVAELLGEDLEQLVTLLPVKRVVLFAHSYGGVVAVLAAQWLHLQLPIEIHLIATPLAGYPKLFDHCPKLARDSRNRLTYPPPPPNVSFIQWRTRKQQDGAFRQLDFDPQQVELPGSEVILLPETMDGHRLGHNWSVTWVVDSYLGRPHN